MNPSGIACQLAEIHAYRGETDAAFEALERAAACHDSGLVDAANNPLLRSLRADPRWRTCLTHAGLMQGT